MNIAVLGATGMAGSMVSAYLKSVGHRIIEVNRKDVNIFSMESISRMIYNLEERNVDFIINCIGILVRESNLRPDLAIHVNAQFPQFLAHTIKKTHIRLVHLSTDCVFNGTDGPYDESRVHNEMNYYGRSKSLGEVDNDVDVTFRMSIIGPEKKKEGTGLFNWFVRNPEEEVNGFTNAWWNGITTLELAKAINHHVSNPKTTGIYNLVPDCQISKYELLCEINDVFDLNKQVNPVVFEDGKIVNKILIDTQKTFGYDFLEYREQLVDMKKFMVEYYGFQRAA